MKRGNIDTIKNDGNAKETYWNGSGFVAKRKYFHPLTFDRRIFGGI